MLPPVMGKEIISGILSEQRNKIKCKANLTNTSRAEELKRLWWAIA
jgi:hypothetical protein